MPMVAFANQPDIYFALVERLYPTSQPVQPPFAANKHLPHMHSEDDTNEISFRIREVHFEVFQGPVHDIWQLASLISRRGNHPNYPEYKVDAFQRTAGCYSFISINEGYSQMLVDYAKKSKGFTVLVEMVD
jgi:hypothetical protein